jgi:hypothetical protein
VHCIHEGDMDSTESIMRKQRNTLTRVGDVPNGMSGAGR